MTDRLTLAGQIVVIAGGSEGIGLAVARLAAQAGAKVLIGSRSERKLAAACAQLESEGLSVDAATVDARDEQSVEGFFQAIGAIDHLAILIGGPVVPTPFVEQSLVGVEASARAKLFAQWLVARFGVPKVRAGGSVTLTSGTASRRFSGGMTWLSMINGGIDALGKSLAAELAPARVRVNVVTPGITNTNLWTSLPDAARIGLLDGAAKRLPVGFVAEPEDIAVAYLHLMCSRYVTGAVLDIDGGALVA